MACIEANNARVIVALGLCVLMASPVCAQAPELVYVSDVTGVAGDGSTPTVEAQTRLMLERLGAELEGRGLTYRDVVVSNVFLSDARNFQPLNAIYREYFDTDPPTRATVQADLVDPAALVRISVVATGAEKEVVTPQGMLSPALPYSWGIKVGSMLFMAGATSRSPQTYQPVEGNVATQTRRVFGNIGLVLEAAGMDSGDLVSCRAFLDDPRRFGAMNAAYAESVRPGDPPARATVRSGLMNPVFQVEIQCIADASADRRVVEPEGAQRNPFPYSPAIFAGGRLYLAGVVGRGPDIEAQTRNALDRLSAILSAAELTLSDVEDVWVFVGDVRDADAVLRIVHETLPPGAPRGTTVGARLMGRGGVEIQMVAKR